MMNHRGKKGEINRARSVRPRRRRLQGNVQQVAGRPRVTGRPETPLAQRAENETATRKDVTAQPWDSTAAHQSQVGLYSPLSRKTLLWAKFDDAKSPSIASTAYS
jgi:hypothetical protein